MARTGTCTPARHRARLRCEDLEHRHLLSATTCTLAGGVLNVACGDGGDAIVIDRQTPAINVTVDGQPFSFPAAAVQQVRVTGLQPADLVLLDTTLDVPTYVNWQEGARTAGGWLAPQPVIASTSNLYIYGTVGGPIAEDEAGHSHNGGKLHQIVVTNLLDNGQVPVQPEEPVAATFAALVTAPQSGFSGSEGFLAGHAGHVATGEAGVASLGTSGMGGTLMEAGGFGHAGMSSAAGRDGAGGTTEPEPGHKPG